MLSELQSVVETLSSEKQELESRLSSVSGEVADQERLRQELETERQVRQELEVRLETAGALEKEARENAQKEAATRAEVGYVTGFGGRGE